MVEKEIEHFDDKKLIELAVNGSNNAFTILLERHRSQAFRWAVALTKDSYIAEDMVQEAFIRAHQNLHALEEKDRFLPWLKRIIYNQTATFFRKRENSHLVQPFSSFKTFVQSQEGQDLLNDQEQILQLIQHVTGTTNLRDDLSDALAEKETFIAISKWLDRLSPQEKEMMYAYFYQELSSDEIAALFDSKASRVYNTISKAKKKLVNVRYQSEIAGYIRSRNDGLANQKVILPVPKITTSYTSMAHVMVHMLQYTKKSTYSLTEVMGLTGQAFRLQIAKDCDRSSSFIYDWGSVCKKGLYNLGFRSTFLGHPNYSDLSPDSVIESIELIQSSINKGIPALAWNLSPSEFCLIYGYDNEKREFIYRDVAKEKNSISYDQLGRHMKGTDLFVAVIQGEVKHSSLRYEKICYDPSFIYALQSIEAHLLGNEKAIPGYSLGLDAYETWINAIQTGQIDSIGHAYQVALFSEARYHALEFLNEMSRRQVYISTESHRQYVALMEKALHVYQFVYQQYKQMYPSFPNTLQLSNKTQKESIISCLRQCKIAESKGALLFKELLSIASILT